MRAADEGAALILVLLVMVLVTALSAAFLVLTDLEVTSAGNQRDGVEALYVADAGLEFTLDELSRLPSWSSVLNGTSTSTFVDVTTQPFTMFGGRVDLLALTSALQNQTDARGWWGANNPRWRLFAYGPFSRLSPVIDPTQATYLVVWVADDVGEVDGDPWADANGAVRVRAEALGRRGTRRVVEAVAGRTNQPGVRLISWREAR